MKTVCECVLKQGRIKLNSKQYWCTESCLECRKFPAKKLAEKTMTILLKREETWQ